MHSRQNGPFALWLECGDKDLRIPLNPNDIAAHAIQWDVDPSGEACAYSLPDESVFRLIPWSSVLLESLFDMSTPPSTLIFRAASPQVDLPQPTILVINILDKALNNLLARRLDLTSSAVVKVPLPERAHKLHLAVRLCGKGIWRPNRIVLETAERQISLEPTRRALSVWKGSRQPPPVKPQSAGENNKIEPGTSVNAWLTQAPMDLRRDLAMLVSTSAAVAAANHATTLAREIQHLQRRIAEIGQQISDSEPGLGVALLRSGLDAEEMLGALLDVKKLSNRLALTLQSLVVDKQQGEYPTRTNLDVEVQRMPADVQWRTALIHKAVSIFEESGLGEALSFMWTNGHPHEYTIYTEELADALSLSHPESCVAAYLVAYGMNALPARAVKIAARLFKAGNLTEARRLIDVGGDVTDSAFLGELRLATALARDGLPLPQRRRCTFATVDGLAYVASSSQPFTISGYTTRTQQLLTALVEEGGTVTCYTRPGYPWDRPGLIKEGTTVPEHQVVSNIKYVHTYVPGIATSGESFITSMASALIERFKEHPPRIVQAASNNRNALPALLASRTLGLPFVYEVRGLWELTAASRIHGWENTERYELDRHLETLIAQEADLVLTITEAVADELREGGVTHDRIRILANGVDPDEFHPLPKDEELVQLFDLKPEELILVYAGSLLVYEGLDDVIEAVCILRDRGLSARLFILGDGPYRGELEAKALQCRAGTNVRFLGRVRPDEVSRYLSLADVVPITRKPFRVCEVVSPLKPFEAMAMGKAVVLTDLKALREIVVDKQRGRLCRPADPTHLADVLSELTLDRDECARLGMAGRDWVINHRSWRAHARSLLSYHKEIVA